MADAHPQLPGDPTGLDVLGEEDARVPAEDLDQRVGASDVAGAGCESRAVVAAEHRHAVLLRLHPLTKRARLEDVALQTRKRSAVAPYRLDGALEAGSGNGVGVEAGRVGRGHLA